MTFSSPYFESVEDALSVASDLVGEDKLHSIDRQRIANFYNGRETLSPEEAEQDNVKNIVNHLFGYNSVDQLRQQITSIMTADERIWSVKINHPDYENDIARRNELEELISEELNKRIRKSKRLKPEYRALAGNVVLHGRDTLTFVDKFDWCPRSSFIYVPGDTDTVAENFTYGFKADRIPLWRLRSYLKITEGLSDPAASGWNKEALREAIEALKGGHGAGSSKIVSLDSEEKESENSNQDKGSFNQSRSSSMTLPVWYLYEVDHSKASKPVSVSIIARYNFTGEGKLGEDQRKREVLLYSKKAHFESVRHWLFPFFIDTEIGGVSTWHSAVGIGRLNYPRDADIEEFFNLAMDGAKDACRMKWQMADGASREKALRFFQERSDLVPEGMTAVPQQASGQFKEAFNVITVLQTLSKETAGGAMTNQGGRDELQIQAQERQSRASALIASRMSDIYDGSDDVGTEILRRFCSSPATESNPGYADVKAFRDSLEEKGVTEEELRKLCAEENGVMKFMQARTSRAAGEGSPSREMAINDRLMQSLGFFGPEAQELIKRRVVNQWTRDPDFARAIVPFERRPDPDQVARARNENTAAIMRGVVGFVPEVNADDVTMVHIPEHDSAIDALIAGAVNQGYMTPAESAGFQSLAQHQSMHIQNLENDSANAELANAAAQKLQKQATDASGLAKAYETNGPGANSEMTEAERVKAQHKQRELDQRDRTQAAVELDREQRRDLDRQKFALDQVTKINDSAAKAVTAASPIPQQAQ